MLPRMTLATIERCVLVRVLLIQPLLVVMTRKADRLQGFLFVELQFERLVRIMATGTVFDHIMASLSARMTAVAMLGRDLSVRFVLWVASSATAKFLLVGSPLVGETSRLCRVTCAAEVDRDIDLRLKIDILRLVRQVTEHAIALHHRLFMPCMAIETDPDFLVFTVASGTVLLTVPTWHITELLLDLHVAADTDRSLRLIPFKLKLQWLMRHMTGVTVANRIMLVIARRMAEEAGIWNTDAFLRVFTVALDTR